jgi:hypothetical protein
MVAINQSFDLSEAELRSQFAMIQPQIRRHIEDSRSSGDSSGLAESIEHAMERAYRLFVRLAKSGSRELVYPTPLAMAAVKLTDTRSQFRG